MHSPSSVPQQLKLWKVKQLAQNRRILDKAECLSEAFTIFGGQGRTKNTHFSQN
jgi:hypothetical protein